MSEPTREDLIRLEATAREVGRLIRGPFDQVGACFALLGFSKGEGGWATWVSNAERADMIQALREMADKLEADIDMPPMRAGEPES